MPNHTIEKIATIILFVNQFVTIMYLDICFILVYTIFFLVNQFVTIMYLDNCGILVYYYNFFL